MAFEWQVMMDQSEEAGEGAVSVGEGMTLILNQQIHAWEHCWLPITQLTNKTSALWYFSSYSFSYKVTADGGCGVAVRDPFCQARPW